VDIDALLGESSAARAKQQHDLAESLSQSVLPLFVYSETGRPVHFGSCVLVRVNGHHYAFTAGHVIKHAGSAHLWAAAANTKLEPLPYITQFASQAEDGELGDIDIGILPLKSGSLGPFAACRFLEDLDAEGKADHQWFENFYFVIGYPASRSQSDTDHRGKTIHVKIFHLATNPAPGNAYVEEKLSRAEHLLIEFDHRNTVVAQSKVVPPKLQGVSGGGIFCISRTRNIGPLIAIATEHRKRSSILAGTRVRYFVQAARELARTEPMDIFE